ncbi:nucleoredoxin-like [Haliotis rufescens]|uniref:nucleoredoxin-like n=1 Tax=Haliotis rufescens TaxID=6454 RepID=UPI001EB091EB|nr:nucleoredoxin-like [Haliotis rufescens]
MSGKYDLAELFGTNVLDQHKNKVDVSFFTGEGKYVGIYFSAHWCPPCRGFTPALAQFYNTMKKSGQLEIVFVSSDRDQASFDNYYKEMPWLALSFEDREMKAKLCQTFEVTGIPCFVLMDGSTGKLITKDGRSHVASDPEGANFPWKQ